MVGVNTAIFSRSGGYMGIVIQPLTAELAESFDMEQSQGILIAQVSADSPAHAGVSRRAMSSSATRASR